MCDWKGYLSGGFDADLVECIKNKVLDAAISEIKPQEIVSETGIAEEDVMEFLKLLSKEESVIKIKQRLRCPFCGELIKDPGSENGHYCEAENDYVDRSDLEVEEYFQLNVDPSRSIRWAVVIHGMNTRGPWQEDLVWKLSHIKKYSIPVYVYKYGLVRIGVTLGFLQKRRVKILATQLRNISKAADPDNAGLRPHVIAHSFGTWLIAHALKEHPDIKIGRLILLGSIVRPDFDWMKLINDKQIEAILNHTAGKDKPVRFSQLFIPDSGPGGRVGFQSEEVINIRSPEFGHSGYFKRNRMTGYLSKDGVWSRFLQRPLSNLPDTFDDQFKCAGWKPIWCILRTFVRYLTLLAVIGIIGFLCYILYTGIINIF
ncbi:MAG: hypothetical protein K8S24_05790 [Candidatus Aegiribacteria sp.]|nr:hypothetical protein [Candidatus Aegiribacteria sp.]